MTDEQTLKQDLADKLKKLREEKGLSREDVAQGSGISVDLLRQYEEGEVYPALGELMNLAKVFDVGMGYFFLAEMSDARVEVVRAGDRWKVRPQTDAAATLNYSYEALSYRMTEKMMSPFHIEIPPSQGKDVDPASAHDGEEFLYVLSGEVEVRIGGEAHQLEAGDSIYYDSRVPHSVSAPGTQPATLLACFVNVRRASADGDPMTRAF